MFLNGKIAPLGKKAPRLDHRTLRLAKYLTIKPEVYLPPNEVSWITRLQSAEQLPMYLNDDIGDCVAAAAGHMIQQWNFYAGHPAKPTDQDIQKSYEDVGGYIPGDPSTDNGMDMLSYLKYWRTVGVGGHKILAFVSVDFTNISEVKAAIQLFGNLYIGLALPVAAQGQGAWTVSDNWTNTDNGQPGSWGGHCVPLFAASMLTRTCVTWGVGLKMSDNFFEDYCDEAYAVLSSEWMDVTGHSPMGLDLSQLKSDLLEITDTKKE